MRNTFEATTKRNLVDISDTFKRCVECSGILDLEEVTKKVSLPYCPNDSCPAYLLYQTGI